MLIVRIEWTINEWIQEKIDTQESKGLLVQIKYCKLSLTTEIHMQQSRLDHITAKEEATASF